MIKIIDKPPIKFEKIVKEATENALSKYGFTFEGDFPSTPEEDENVIYSRKRKDIEEQIKFFRSDYSNEYKDETDDEVEKEPYVYPDNSGFMWISRHRFQILLIVNYGFRYLLTSGEAGIGRKGEKYWYFEDEENLRKLLEEKIAPLLTTVVMKDFDEQLKDELEYSVKKKNEQTNHEQISNALS